jgi:hypothetical protein
MNLLRVLVSATLLFSTLCAAAGDKKNAPDNLSVLRFSVIKDDNGQPVRNASVIIHPVGKNGKQSKGGFQLKTDSEGKTQSDGIPYGMLRVQVLAHGFQTFGQDYEVNQSQMDIGIRLKRPQEQFTIYGKPGTKEPDGQPQQATPKQ